MLDRAILSGTSHIGIAQGLMMTYWKSPADTSAWKKIGMAIRMGYQLRWHLPRLDALPDNDMAAREVLVGLDFVCVNRADVGKERGEDLVL